jgi:exosortase
MSRRSLTAVVAVTSAVLWLYATTLSSLAAQWASDEDYSHGFFVAPLAAFFLWERREAFRHLDPQPSRSGLVLIIMSLGVFVAGRLGAELFLTRISLVGLLAGIVWFMAGRAHLRAAAFPLAFLVLMVPLPAIVFNQITVPLQTVAARTGEIVIAAAGVPVLRDGNILQVPGRTLEVAEACSGIRSLISLFTLAIVLGYFADPSARGGRGDGRRSGERRTAARVALVVAALPIAIVANAARVAGTGLACYWLSPAAADGFFHGFSGWLMFAIALTGLLVAQRAIAWTTFPRTLARARQVPA